MLKRLIESKGQCTPCYEREVCLLSISPSDWRRPIVEFLKNPDVAVDKKTKSRALNYAILGDVLFKKSVDVNLLTCPGELEAYIALTEVHEGICGAHQVGDKMKWTVYRCRVYWPSMIKDYFEFAKSCEECQKHGSIQHVPVA